MLNRKTCRIPMAAAGLVDSFSLGRPREAATAAGVITFGGATPTDTNHRALISLSAFTLARLVIAPAAVSVGIITALVGAPFFLALLIRNKERASML